MYTIQINEWEASVTRRSKYTGYRNTEKYYLKINDSGESIYRHGEIVNDFLCLCKYDGNNIILFKDRLKRWVDKYGYPMLSINEEDRIIDYNAYVTVESNGSFIPVGPSERTGFVDKIINPADAGRYMQAVRSRFHEITLYLSYPETALPPIQIQTEFMHETASSNIRYLFEKDIYPLLMFDIFHVLGKYTLDFCPQCGAPYLPVRGLTHCTGGCKPVSKMSGKEREDRQLKSKRISNDNERSALIKRLNRSGTSREEIYTHGELADAGCRGS